MSKLVLNNITSGYNTTTALNDNFDRIEAAIENTLSRDNSQPNQMNANIDLNGNRVLNSGRATSINDLVSLGQLLEFVDNSGVDLTGVIPITWEFISTGEPSYTLPLASTKAINMYIITVDGVTIPPSAYVVQPLTQTLLFLNEVPPIYSKIVVRLFGKIPEVSGSGVTINNTKRTLHFPVVGLETTFLFGFPLEDGATDVFLNGVKLLYPQDYTISGTSIELTSSANAGDILEVTTYSAIVAPSVTLLEIQDAVAIALSASAEAQGAALTVNSDAADAIASAAAALLSETNAATSASNAQTSASNAFTSEGNAINSATSAIAAWDSFDDRYLGAKAADPTLDNDGNALVVGALYFNSTSSEMKVWSGSAWNVGYLPVEAYLLDTDIGTTVQAYDADLTTWAGVTPGVGVATALAVAVGTAGAPVVNGGALGTPSSGIATNLSGTAASLTAGTVTTNANLSGHVTSVGNTTSLGTFTVAQLNTAISDATVATGGGTATGTNTGDQTASTVTNTPAGNIAATTVQAALNELDAEKAKLAGDAAQNFAMLNGTVAGTLKTTGWAGFGKTALEMPVDIYTPPSDTLGQGSLALSYSDFSNGALWATRMAASGSGYDYCLDRRSVNIWYNALTINRTTGAVTIPGTLSLTGASSTMGYGAGAGGTVTQATSKSTVVTLNRPSGKITMAADALAAGASVIFTLSNSMFLSNDLVVLTGLWSGPNPINYRIEVAGSSSSNIDIRVTNISAGSLSEAVVIKFAIIRGATS